MTVKNIKQETSYINKKISNLLKNQQPKFLTGFLLLCFITIFAVTQAGFVIANYLSTSFPKVNTYSIPKQLSILESTPSSISVTTPPSANAKTPVIESGQISAVSTKQVTSFNKEYLIQKGDTLFIISEKVYGDKNAWMRIATENKIINPDKIEVGQILKIPR